MADLKQKFRRLICDILCHEITDSRCKICGIRFTVPAPKRLFERRYYKEPEICRPEIKRGTFTRLKQYRNSSLSGSLQSSCSWVRIKCSECSYVFEILTSNRYETRCVKCNCQGKINGV
jgi:hypothetical protein